jgi:hypothetical protein
VNIADVSLSIKGVAYLFGERMHDVRLRVIKSLLGVLHVQEKI